MATELKLPIELEPYRSKFENSVKPYVQVNKIKRKTVLWESKFGGEPYFPLDEDYPRDLDGVPMKLLAQINFEELPEMDSLPEISLLPKQGILQIYITTTDDLYGLDFDNLTNQENFRIIYFHEVIKDETKLWNDFSFVPHTEYFPISRKPTLNEWESMQSVYSKKIFSPIDESNFALSSDDEPEYALSFELSCEPVSIYDYHFKKVIGFDNYEFFSQFGEESEDEIRNNYSEHYSGEGDKIGGYAYFTQEDPRGYDYDDFNFLLLQMDTDDDIMWGDTGVGNFFIRKSDLQKLDFSNVLYTWDCL